MTINRRRLNKQRAVAAAAQAGWDFTPQARYDAAGQGRRIKSWNPPTGVGPNRATLGLQKIRDRSRDAGRNDWAGASANQKWPTALVGTGIVPRYESDDLNDLFAEHVKTCDANCVLDFYGLQLLGVGTWIASGEVFCRKRPRDLALVYAGKLAAPLQYQLLAPEFVPIFDAEVWPGMPEGNCIRQGIELNKYDRRIAYWMHRTHPGDQPSGTPSFESLVRVPADQVAHLYDVKEPGQLRGVPESAPVLPRMRSAGDFEDAVLDRQKLANLFVAFLRREMPEQWSEIETDPLTGLPKWYSDRGAPLVGLEPGIFQELHAGESVEFGNPPGPAAGFGEYMRTTHMGTAAARGIPYELFSGDILNVSDRTLRVLINEFRRLAEQRQWINVIPMLCEPMVRWWAEALTLTGDISTSRVREAKNPTWNPMGWEYIHPVQDVEGKLKAIAGGLTSVTAEILKRGDDPRKVFAQRAADQALAQELGIQPATAPPAPAAAQQQMHLTMENFQAQMHQSVMAFGAQLSAAVLGRKIEVAAPNVVVNNEQAPVVVTANVNLPDREIVTESVEHDEQGRIIGVTQVERTRGTMQ